MAIFWDLVPCSLADIDRPFREAPSLISAMDRVNSSETSANISQNA
jgi:hypothetical protein